jgi:hypothetical protein
MPNNGGSVNNIVPLVASFLLFSISAPNTSPGSLDNSRSPENPAVSISPLLGTPKPARMACSIGWNANDDYVTTAKNTPVTFSPLWNDDDTPQQNFGGVTSSPHHGTLEQVGLDALKYTPASGYTGSDSFTYQHIGCLECFCDWSCWCAEPSEDTATVYITVTN